jgi:predicted SprT family Zn-dependent metalloprotease
MIRKSFNLAGQKFTVKFKRRGLTNCWGRFLPEKNEIWLCESLKKNPDLLGVTFYHEMSHAMMYVMGEDDLYANEKFIDNLAHLLYQLYKDS